MQIFSRSIFLLFMLVLLAGKAHSYLTESLLPDEGKITCGTIKCHISRIKNDSAHYLTAENYSTESRFWGCGIDDNREPVWLEINCVSDCLSILDFQTCSNVCATIAHDIEIQNINIGEKMCF